ncbi:MAG: exo-alpha-sialidase [Planctomycetaceae bacterium]|nr:MAG: exo-alpha-sialidase [Planctomycetaceae bacterium]
MTIALGLVSIFGSLGMSAANAQTDIELRFPQHRVARVLVESSPSRPDHYLAFPAVLDLGEDVLVSFKRGLRHGGDAEATLEWLRIAGPSREAGQPRPLVADAGKIMQMGEWVRFPNGDIANYVDVQQVDASGRNRRTGTLGVRSTDGGRTFGTPQPLGLVDGVEYGYPFSFLVEGNTTWMLVMTFSDLTGGYSVYRRRPHAGPVCVLRSDDDGTTWQFVKNLTETFGNLPINESYFIRHGDGFLVVTRGYDERVRLHLVDARFRLLRQADLTEDCPLIDRYVGRPRLFVRDGATYLIGRNWVGKHRSATRGPDPDSILSADVMRLCLFRLDPDRLAVTSATLLDNQASENVTDGYYPSPYFRAVGDVTYLHVVDYKGVDRKPPQIIELEFLWDEVR